MTAGIMVTGVAGIGITAAMYRAATIAAGFPDIMTATTTADLVGATGIIARTGMVTAGVTTDGAAVAADVTTVGAAAVVADTTAIADVVDIAAVTNRDRADEGGPAFAAGLFYGGFR